MAKEELVLSDYLGVLLRRKWLVIAATALVVGFTYWWAAQQPTYYQSRIRIKLQRQITFSEMFDQVLVSGGDPLENCMQEIASYIVASNAAAALMAPARPKDADIAGVQGSIRVERVKETDMLDIYTTGMSSAEARRRVETVAGAFIVVHDDTLSRNAQDVYQSIQDSRDKLKADFKQREAVLLQNLGGDGLRAADADAMAPLRQRAEDYEQQLRDLRVSGNYTEDYPEIVSLKTRLAQLRTEIEKQERVELNQRTLLAEYERDKATVNDIDIFFSRRIEEAKIAVNKKSEVVVVIEPAADGAPINSGWLRKTVAGGLLGFMFGVVLAFIADHLDTSVRTVVEIEELFHLPVLGLIPHFSIHDTLAPIGRRRLKDILRQTWPVQSVRVLWVAVSGGARRRGQRAAHAGELIVPFSARSPATEAYRTLRTHLQLLLRPGANILLVTSAGPEEGKSTTICNLALTFAQAGKKTLLVGANMRRPQMYRIFGLTRERGLSDVLVGDIPWREAVKDYRDIALGAEADRDLSTAPGIDNLSFITAGGRTVHPAELLSQPTFGGLAADWMNAFEVVLVDAPPVLPVPDSVILATTIKQTMIVYRIGSSGRESVQRAISSLQNAGTTLVGIVLNDLHASWITPDFYHYRTYYGRPE